MRVSQLLAAAPFAWVVLAAPGHAQCSGCPGDFDGNGTVSIDEVVTVVNAALGGCSPSFFNEEFLGDQLSPQRWTASANGYPAPAVAVGDGSVRLGQPGATSLDFPYVESLGLPFPDGGDVQLEVVMQFTGTGPNGSFFTVIGANGRSLVRIRNQSAEPSGLTVSVPGARGALTDFTPEGVHTYRMTFRGDRLDVAVDGSPVFGNFPVDGQPRSVWFGHPTLGQRFGIDETDERPSGIDGTGFVVERWWDEAEWSTLRVDSITVRRLATP